MGRGCVKKLEILLDAAIISNGVVEEKSVFVRR
jgi:hypothetical protein